MTVVSRAMDAAVAVHGRGPGWVDGALTIPGGTARGVRAARFLTERADDGSQARGALLLVAIAQCPDKPVDGTLVALPSYGETWEVREASRNQAVWRMRARRAVA